MPNHPRLYLRGKTYYLRAAVPADMQDSYGKKLVVRSLRVTSLKEALPLLRAASAKIDEEFEAHRQAQIGEPAPSTAPTPRGNTQLTPEQYKKTYIENHLKRRAELFEAAKNDMDAFDNGDLIDLPNTPYFFHLSGDGTWMDLLAYCIKFELKAILKATKKSEKQGSYGDLIDLAGGSATDAVRLMHAQIEALESLISGIEKNTPDSEGTYEAKTSPTKQALAENHENEDLLSQAIEKYLEDLRMSGREEKTINGKRPVLQEFIEICKDKAINNYSKRDGRFYKNIITDLPINWRDNKRFKHIGAIKASEIAKADANISRLSTKTFNERIGAVTACFNWIERNYDPDIKNPVASMKRPETKRPGDKRKPFSSQDLTKIFNAPVFTGCESDRNWKNPGKNVLQSSAKYWVPLIGLYTGMRLGEIIQLHCEDIKCEDGRDYFDICRKTKTAAGLRKIPIHPVLLDLGFLEFLKEREDRIFLEYQQAKDDSWSDAFSKHFRRFLKNINVDGSFHCFRHNFEDVCRQNGVTADVMDALQGHTQEKMRGTYGDQSNLFGIKRLSDELRKIEYAGLNLRHLPVFKRTTDQTNTDGNQK